MDRFAKSLPPDDAATLKGILAAGFPQSKPQTWKGHHIIPQFSADAAEYAYDNWNLREGDVFLVSFPKTGTNWTGEVIRQIVYQETESDEFSKSLPMQLKCLELQPCEKFSVLDKMPLPRRLLASHLPAELMNMDKIKKANAKVVYVLRNPKDQIVSWLKFIQSLPGGKVEPVKSMIESGWDKYVEHTVAGDFAMNTKPGEWYPDHILSWYKHRDNKTVYFVYYEDMKQDFPREIKRLADFLDVQISEEKVNRIAEACSFGNMKKEMTNQDTLHAKVLSINMRKGQVGGWKDYFTVSQSERIDAIMEEKLKGTDIKFTYEL